MKKKRESGIDAACCAALSFFRAAEIFDRWQQMRKKAEGKKREKKYDRWVHNTQKMFAG